MQNFSGDDIHQKLWKRKMLKNRRRRNDLNKVKKNFHKEQENGQAVIDPKKKEFYEKLLSGEMLEEGERPKNKKQKKQKVPGAKEDQNEESKGQVGESKGNNKSDKKTEGKDKNEKSFGGHLDHVKKLREQKEQERER